MIGAEQQQQLQRDSFLFIMCFESGFVNERKWFKDLKTANFY